MAWAPWRERGTVPAAVLPPTRGVLDARPRAGGAIRAAGYFAIVGLWAAFILTLALSPETLDAMWQWFRHLDRPSQVVGWIVLLPWTAGVAVWATSWLLGVKLLLIGMLAVATILGYAPRPHGD